MNQILFLQVLKYCLKFQHRKSGCLVDLREALDSADRHALRTVLPAGSTPEKLTILEITQLNYAFMEQELAEAASTRVLRGGR